MIFAIGDLHLSFAHSKPMNIFGTNWAGHEQKIKRNWEEVVTARDTVIIPGDISWAMKYEDAKKDLSFINDLPGKKVILQGNHDYWWNSTSKISADYPEIFFLRNNFYESEGFSICGSRGWLCPNDFRFTSHDMKIYKREVGRIKISLESAIQNGHKDILLALHFPPANDKKQRSEIMDLVRQYNVKKVLYAHLHGKKSFKAGITGSHEGCEYYLVSADYLDFKPKQIIP